MKYIKNFNERLFENILLEKALIIGEKLKSVFKGMKHPFASLLLSKLGDDLVDSSYIELDEDPGMITWLPSNREVDYHTKKELSEPEKWSKGRTKQPIARVVKAILTKLNIAFSESDIEKFVNEYKSLQKPSNFILAKGDDIAKYYSERKYTHDNESDSSLMNSCMRYEDKRHFFSVYVKNPNVRLVVMLDEYNYVLGRAILWLNAVIDDKPAIFMDRIYVAKQAYEELFKSYAIDNDWWFKVQQSSGSGKITNGKNTIESPKIRVIIPDLDWSQLEKPYLDTLQYFKEEFIDGKFAYTLSNYAGNTDWKENWRNQDGGFSENRLYESPAMEMKIISTELELDISKLEPQKTKGVYKYGNSKYWITTLDISKRRCIAKLMKDDNWKRFATIKTLSNRYDYMIRNQMRDKVEEDIKADPKKYMELMKDKLTPYFWVSNLTSNIIEGETYFLTDILRSLLKNKANYKKFYPIMYGEMNRYVDGELNMTDMEEYSEANAEEMCKLFNENNTRRMRQFIIDKFENKDKFDKKFNDYVLKVLPKEQLVEELESKFFNSHDYEEIARMNPQFFDKDKFLADVYKDVASSKYSLKWLCQSLANNQEIRANVLSTDGVEINFSEKYIYKIR